ncbi:MAG: hypothetical protein MUP22_01000 [Desulfobacterales bacterium]|nr:hypothetical protein [Desulfobacterales bacterium]
METFNIQYKFTLPDQSNEVFDLQFDSKDLILINNIPSILPSWTDLNYYQCPNCIIDPDAYTFCPLSANLVSIVNRFKGLLSFDKVAIDVSTIERTVSQQTTVQRGISSLMGLIIATSGCPHTAFFKPMARFHLPLSSKEETIYRATSMYLLAQYFLYNDNIKADLEFEGLKKIYKNAQLVNTSIANRLRAASDTDSSVNAITLLDMYAQSLPFAIGDSLEDIKYLFTAFLTPQA